MPVLKKDVVIPLNRMMFISKDGTFAKEDLVVESEGAYLVMEKDDCFIIKNDDCCRSIKVTVKTRD